MGYSGKKNYRYLQGNRLEKSMIKNFLIRILKSNMLYRFLSFISFFGWRLKFDEKKIFKTYHKKYKIIDNREIILNRDSSLFFFYLDKIISKSPPGCVVECGLGKFKSFQMISFILQKEKIKRKFFGFDSFMGFPEVSEEDKSPRNPKKGDWNIVDFDLSKKFLQNHKINNFILVKGFLEETLPIWKKKLPQIAILHIDVDLYESYKTALENLYDKVVNGGYVLFDEYDNKKFPGAKKAIDEFFNKKKKKIQKDPIGKYFIKK